MGKVNDRNLQFRLAFSDQDLSKPTHDTMIRWLERWATEPTNVCRLLGWSGDWFARSATTRKVLDPASVATWEPARQRDQVVRSFQEMSLREKYDPPRSVPPEAWADAPMPRWELAKPVWEPLLPLGIRLDGEHHRRFIGFCDLLLSYTFDHSLFQVTEHSYRVVQPPADRFASSWRFEPTGSSVAKWEPHSTSLRICFEVKTEIRSIGELMRQLQFYSAALPRRNVDRPPGYDETWLCVLAPPHPEAADVCRSHGIPFLDYTP